MQNFPLEYVFEATLGAYSEEKRTMRDVSNCINVHPTLHPELRQFGKQMLVLILGTIPVEYLGTVYHFPVELLILSRYPFEAPQLRVVPSQELKITPGHAHVD